MKTEPILADGRDRERARAAAEQWLGEGEPRRTCERLREEGKLAESASEETFSEMLTLTEDFCRTLPHANGFFGEEGTRGETVSRLCRFLTALSEREGALTEAMGRYASLSDALASASILLLHIEEGLLECFPDRKGSEWEVFLTEKQRIGTLGETVRKGRDELTDWRCRILPSFRERVMEAADLLHNGAACRVGSIAELSGNLAKLMKDRSGVSKPN